MQSSFRVGVEFKIILKQKWGVSCFIFPSITSDHHSHLTLATAPPILSLESSSPTEENHLLPQQQAIPSKATPICVSTCVHTVCTHTCMHAQVHNLYLTKQTIAASEFKREKERKKEYFVYKSKDQNSKLLISNSHI